MKQNLVLTSHGVDIGIGASLVRGGEGIVNLKEDSKNYGEASLVTAGSGKRDDVLSNVMPNGPETIFGSLMNPFTGNKFEVDAAPAIITVENNNNKVEKVKNNKYAKLSSLHKQTLELSNKNRNLQNKQPLEYLKTLNDIQSNVRNNDEMINNMANCGKSVKRYDAGKAIIPGILGVGSSLAQMYHWLSEPVKYNSTYAANPFLNRVIEGLGGLRQNIYPQQRAIYDAESRGGYGLSNMGGLTSGQRAANRVALALGSGRNMADAIAANQAANIGLATNKYKTMAEMGQQDRAARMNANLFDRQDFVAAHGAKTKGIETGLTNLQQQVGNWYKNDFKYDTWQDTLKLYNQQLTNEQQKTIDMLRESQANRNAQLAIARMNNGGYIYNPASLYGMWMIKNRLGV